MTTTRPRKKPAGRATSQSEGPGEKPRRPRPKLAFCTVASRNYLAKVRALAESLERFHPGVPLYALVVDRLDGFDPDREPFECVRLDALDIADLPRFTFQYSIVELNTATKPFLMRHLFDAHGLERLIYLDPDVLLFRPLDRALDALDTSTLILTPHRTAPRTADHFPTDVDLCRFGAYNLGFLALRRAPSTDAFLAWWRARLYTGCIEDAERGYFVDQKWIDLVPSYFEGVHVLRDPTYNVARWNVPERRLGWQDEVLSVDGEVAAFFHFSRVDTGRDGRVRHIEDGAMRGLLRHYEAALERLGHASTRGVPYGFESFDNGVAIPPGARRRYHELGAKAAAFGDPFETAPKTSYYRWLARFQRGALLGDLRTTRRHVGLSLRFWGEVARGLWPRLTLRV